MKEFKPFPVEQTAAESKESGVLNRLEKKLVVEPVLPEKTKKLETQSAKKEKKVEEKRSKEELKKDFFNRSFNFESQREISAKTKVLESWEKYWQLDNSRSVILNKLDFLLEKLGSDEDKVTFKELDKYFRGRREIVPKKGANELAAALRGQAFVKEEKAKELNNEEYRDNLKRLLYLYDRYYEPKLIEDINGLKEDKRTAEEKKKASKEENDKYLPEAVPAYLKDFYVKAFPLLSEKEQAVFYDVLLKNRQLVESRVRLPIWHLYEFDNKTGKRTKKEEMSDADRKKYLFTKRKQLVDKFINLPLESIPDLHRVELKNALALVDEIIKDKNISFKQKIKADKQYKDPQYAIYKKIQAELQSELSKRLFAEAMINEEHISNRAVDVVRAFRAFLDRSNRLPKLEDKRIESLKVYMNSFDENNYPGLIELLEKPQSEYEKIFARLSVEELKNAAKALIDLQKRIKAANKVINDYEEKTKAEKLREQLLSHLDKADLEAGRKFWNILGEDARDISIRFAADKERKTMPVAMKSRLKDASEELLEEKNIAELGNIDLDLSFNALYDELLPEIQSEKAGVLENIESSYNEASTLKEKKKYIGELKKLSINNWDLRFAKLKEKIAGNKNISQKEKKALNIIATRYEKANNLNAKKAIYMDLEKLK